MLINRKSFVDGVERRKFFKILIEIYSKSVIIMHAWSVPYDWHSVKLFTSVQF